MSEMRKLRAVMRSGSELKELAMPVKRINGALSDQLPLIKKRIPSIYTLYSTLIDDPRNNIAITYHQDIDIADDVYYRVIGQTEWLKTSPVSVEFQGTTKCINHCILTDLTANTEYEFTVGHPSYTAEPYKFITFPDDLTTPLKGAFGGDFQEGEEMWATMVDLVASQDCRFFTVLGDWVGDDGKLTNTNKWVNFWNDIAPRLRDTQGRLIPLVPAIGNHEVIGTMARPFFCDMFAFPDEGLKNYGVIDAGDYLSLVVLDDVFYLTNTDWSNARPSFETEKAWLQSTLTARAETEFVVPCYHIPFFASSRTHFEDTEVINREEWLQILIDNNIRMAFSGHDHAYKRSKEITMEDSVERVITGEERGIIEFGDGGLGTKYYPGGLFWKYYIDDIGTDFSHVCIVTFETGKATVVATKSDGTVIDTTEILV